MTAAELKLIEELHRHTEGLASRRVEDDPVVRKLRIAKRITWIFLLAGSFLFYYLLEKMEEALTLLR